MFAHTKMASHIERKLSEHDFFLLILIYYIWMSSHSSEALTFIEYNQFHSRFPYYNHHHTYFDLGSLFLIFLYTTLHTATHIPQWPCKCV